MGCSITKKRQTFSKMDHSQSNQATNTLEQEQVERELLISFFSDHYCIKKNPIIQRRAFSATQIMKSQKQCTLDESPTKKIQKF